MPTVADILRQGLRSHEAGQLQDAEACYRQALAQSPGHPDALHLLGLIAYQVGQHDDAIKLMSQAAQVLTKNASIFNNLGGALRSAGRYPEAAEAFGRALELDPTLIGARNNLADLLVNFGRLGDALLLYRQLTDLQPHDADTHARLAAVYAQLGQLDAAIAEYRRTIDLNPRHAGALTNLGAILKPKGQVDEAIALYRQALEIQPDLIEAHNNLANALQSAMQLDKARTTFERALQLAPDNAAAHHNFSQLLLLLGDYERGWEEHEWRLCVPRLANASQRFPQPIWDGSPLQGRTLLVHAEQGLGDTIQFIRFMARLSRSTDRIILLVQPLIKNLLAGNIDLDELHAWNEPLPQFDIHIPLMSLPRLLRVRLDNVAAGIYIRPDPKRVAAWKKRLANDPSPRKIGLAWAGNPAHINDRARSIPLREFAPLAIAANSSFYSLQKGTGAEQLQNPPPGLSLIDHTASLNDVTDTAALISQLDLLICADVGVAHLAGAMGKPVWILLPFSPDWRWLTERRDSPWYPSAVLFRQPFAGDWPAVMSDVRELLEFTA